MSLPTENESPLQSLQGGTKKLGHCDSVFEGSHICLHLQNAWTNISDSWHTLTPFYSDHICWLYSQKIHHTKWHKVNNCIKVSGLVFFWPTLHFIGFVHSTVARSEPTSVRYNNSLVAQCRLSTVISLLKSVMDRNYDVLAIYIVQE